jgi:hypothetical protein
MVYRVAMTLLVVWLILSCVASLWVRLAHLDMTDSRIGVTFWPIFLLEVVGMIALGCFVAWANGRKK